MRIDTPWKDNPTASFVHDRLSEQGHRFLLVGSAVRNTILGMPVGDIDVATDARPDTVAAAFRQTMAKVETHGIDHGMVMIVLHGVPVEVTSFRRDVETDGRHARIVHSTSVEEDAKRRDFTMNAVYSEFDGTIVDPLGGMEHLLARRVMFVGQARDRIAEDHLRMLRFFRLNAQCGDPNDDLDQEALAAIAEFACGIDTISTERITSELMKLLLAPSPRQALLGMHETGLLDRILPGASTDPILRLEQLEKRFGVVPDSLLRLAALGSDPGRLRLDRRSLSELRKLDSASKCDSSTEEIGYCAGERIGTSAALLRAVRSGLNPPDDLIARVRHGASQRFPVKARHLPTGIEGRRIGETLRILERIWIGSGFAATTAELLASIERPQHCPPREQPDSGLSVNQVHMVEEPNAEAATSVGLVE